MTAQELLRRAAVGCCTGENGGRLCEFHEGMAVGLNLHQQTKTALFQSGDFTLACGATSNFKIECDALTAEDWASLAAVAVKRLAPFGEVEGVPTGGASFAEALRPYATGTGLLIADDVYTTGGSMDRQRNNREAQGVVVFARFPPRLWVVPVFSMQAL